MKMKEAMTSPEKRFVELISQGQNSEAIATVVGASDTALKYSREFARMISFLDLDKQQAFFDWCDQPLVQSQRLVIPENQRWYVEKLARHEIGHAIAARFLGYKTGDISIRVISTAGDHVGSATIFLDEATLGIAEITSYIESRIIILMAGTMAEAESMTEIDVGFDESFKQSNSDHDKARELLQLRSNMAGDKSDGRVDNYYKQLREQTRSIVRDEFDLIKNLANQLASQVKFLGPGVGWSEEDFTQKIEQART